MPSQVSNKPMAKPSHKRPQLPNYSLSENKMPDFDTVEIAALEQIIKNKESRMK
jgi:hypothetical protein